ncbi:MAG: (2Fe-2S) ferredoxin domain-containing protein [Chloroflexi bacterium]|nr:MAG: (2Fe-2S) ferredoxin domain-containing protein [Chloroflexota bacterium]
MSPVKSLDELKRLREEAIQKRNARATFGNAQVIVGMGTCGIAAGARETMKAILGTIEKDNLNDIVVTQTGCIGLCEREPIVQVVVGEGPKVTYGKVTPQVAEKILKEHVVGGNVLKEHVIEM